jgi:tRNA nucleotidyltransferase (CCA-adding enzyme)
LAAAWRTGIVASILPELADQDAAASAARDATIDRCGDAPLAVKLAALLWGLAPPVVDAALRRLTFANAIRERTVKLVGTGPALGAGADEPRVRRALTAVGRAGGDDVVALWRALGAGPTAEAAAQILARGDALAAGELALSGGQLIAALGLPRGPAVGQLVAALLDAVLDDPTRNTADALLAIARARLA